MIECTNGVSLSIVHSMFLNQVSILSYFDSRLTQTGYNLTLGPLVVIKKTTYSKTF